MSRSQNNDWQRHDTESRECRQWAYGRLQKYWECCTGYRQSLRSGPLSFQPILELIREIRQCPGGIRVEIRRLEGPMGATLDQTAECRNERLSRVLQQALVEAQQRAGSREHPTPVELFRAATQVALIERHD